MKSQLKLLVDVLKDSFIMLTDVESLSKLPGKDEMRAQLLAYLEAPMAQTLAVMDALLTSVVYCLENKSKQAEIRQQAKSFKNN